MNALLLALLLAGIGTYATRALFILALANRRFPPLARRALEHVAPAVLAALLVSMLSGGDGELPTLPEVAGVLVALAVAARTRDPLKTLPAAMGVLWVLSYLGF